MSEIKPKKERRFLKTLGRVGEILVEQVLLKLGSSIIKKIGGKKTLPSILFLLASLSLFAQYPATGNKQRLGYQTTGDGLVYRGRASDTTTIKSSGLNNAYFILDTVNNIQYNYIKTKGGWVFSNGDTIIINGVTMPFDSITFNTAKDGTVGVGEVEYNDTQGSLIQGLKGGLVTNIIGQQLHQRVNNRTGATLTKGTAVYLSGSQGNRITVAKALGVTDAFSANTFGIVAENIVNNQSGYVITEGLITNINTSSLVEDSAVYLSPTVAGGLTSTKPQAPQHTVYIGVCVKSNAGSGELFVKIRNGQELEELHNVRITSPVDRASLYYKLSEKLWRDTTAALLTSDTASLSNRINLKLNIADTASMLAPYFKDADTTSLNLTSRFAGKLSLSDTASMLTNYLRSGTAASTYLPLTGGILTGGLTGTSATFSSNVAINTTTAYKPFEAWANANDFVSVGVRPLITGQYSGIHFGYVELNTDYRKSAIVFQRRDYTGGTDASGSIHLLNVTQGQGGRSANLSDAKITISNNGNVGINDTTPSTTLDVNGISAFGSNTGTRLNIGGQSIGFNRRINDGSIYSSGFAYQFQHTTSLVNTSDFLALQVYNSLGTLITPNALLINGLGNVGIGVTTPSYLLDINGTLGVTGATTLSAPLTVNSSAVFNEGSADADFRVESDGNVNMVFVDASTDRVGIGTNAPDKTLHVNGEVKIATVTATPTSLLGKDGSNVVGEVTTVAQTGLMTRGSTTATTGSPSAVFTVTHGLGTNPTSVIVTGTGASGAEKLIYEVYAKNSNTFSVQVWTYLGMEAAGISTTIYWLAIK